MFCSWSENVHVVWTKLSKKISFFSTCELSLVLFFAISDAMSCYFVRATPPTILLWSFGNLANVFFCVWRWACGSNMWFEHYRQTIFFHFFQLTIVVSFRHLKYNEWVLCARNTKFTPTTVLFRSFWNFAGVLYMVWRYACGMDIIVTLIFQLFSLVRFQHHNSI